MEQKCKQFRKRNAILAYLRQTKSHPSAEMVFNELKQEHPDLSLGTVYRNLAMFKAQKVIASIGTVDGIERFDGNTEPHVHFICESCQKVEDLPKIEVPEELCQTVNKQTGGRVEDCHLHFSGTCKDCLAIELKGGETA